MFVFVFVYIKKYKLQTKKRKLNYRDYCSHFVILLVFKVYISLVTQKLMINCTPRNQSNRWNFPAVMIIRLIFFTFLFFVFLFIYFFFSFTLEIYPTFYYTYCLILDFYTDDSSLSFFSKTTFFQQSKYYLGIISNWIFQ